MSVYASERDLEERYGAPEIRQRRGTLPYSAVDQALDDAAAEIDAYLWRRFQLPIDPVPRLLVTIACQLARARLLGDAISEAARNDQKSARAQLADLRDGRQSLPGVAEVGVTIGTGSVQQVSGERIFRRV